MQFSNIIGNLPKLNSDTLPTENDRVFLNEIFLNLHTCSISCSNPLSLNFEEKLSKAYYELAYL